ncbi:hypothetical protein Y88_3775 [Novosphingobium nitrogenifigens DSM 19370]|uniref:Flavin reductase like domain-containing protein n=1 Tax=Novosphingobium nitrogenifigens DSM 19370 TaxID=983920 RepID=F1ZD48_9SPHN|nr:flavin reductase family protein [Novosphingobium nitrogenifigens]EGD57465.1 hypothetical protein Y88_3775 [Novosphingobium nitrogenifigens DSM 19370]
MEFDFTAMPPADRYRLMASAITPRPIAWVSTRSDAGTCNVAPFSFFNMMGADPPIVVLGIGRRPDGTLKDTAANIHDTGEFVVNLVGESDAEAMNRTSIDAPPGIDELALVGIPVLPSIAVAPPRIASAPVAMECSLYRHLDIGSTMLVIGEVLRFHVRDEFYDPVRRHVDTPAMHLVGRAHGGGWYARMTDLFEMQRPNWADQRQNG